MYKIGQVKCFSVRGVVQDTERGVVTEIMRLISGGAGYFAWSQGSGGGDISLTAQRIAQGHGADSQFFWNKLLHLPYLRYGNVLFLNTSINSFTIHIKVNS